MVAGISGPPPTPGSAAGGAEEPPPNMPLKLVVSQPASTTDSIEMTARLATARALPDLIMGIPRTNSHRSRPAAKRKTPTGAMTSDNLRRDPDKVSKHHPIMVSPRP